MRYSTEKEDAKNIKKKLHFGTLNNMPTISEWFVSLEGEGSSIGEPSLYIRLNGCYSAKCSWCDSKYSWYSDEGQELEKIGNDIKEAIKDKEIKRLTITGGEPLHFIDNLESIVSWLKSNGFEFDFIGVESNGNLLQDKKIVMQTIKAFNNIQLNFGPMPKLTISPKLDPEACYGGELTEKEVNDMYSRVFENCINYFDKSNLFFKFVWEVLECPDLNKSNLYFINLLKNYKIQRNHIMLMPWTPLDPHSKDADLWKRSQYLASREALTLGIKYSPRLHIDIEMD